MLTNKEKRIIAAEISARSNNFQSDAAFARSIGINPAQLSRIKKGDIDKVLSEENYLRIANDLEIDLRGFDWKTAKTPTFDFITEQLEFCQENSVSLIMVDDAGVGKSHAAREYVKTHRNAVYLDCSQTKTKQLLIRKIAKKFGLKSTGRYADVYENLVFYLNTLIVPPIIILDEGGDLNYPAFLEVKALWNGTEGNCAFYMLGADGLKAKINRNIGNLKVGYTEFFRRYGEQYHSISPVGKQESDKFKREQFAIVAKANGIKNFQQLYAKTGGSLTRLKTQYLKAKRNEKLKGAAA